MSGPILIVDDDAETRRALASALANGGYSSQAAANEHPGKPIDIECLFVIVDGLFRPAA